MAETDPEELGRELAQTVDRDALVAESSGETVSDLIPEILKSFHIQFRENQNITVRGQQTRIQHELVDTAFMDELNARHTSPSEMTEDQLRSLSRNYARDALHEYANTLVGPDASIKYADLPDETDQYVIDEETVDYFGFTDAIVEGYWNDTASMYIEEYTMADGNTVAL